MDNYDVVFKVKQILKKILQGMIYLTRTLVKKLQIVMIEKRNVPSKRSLKVNQRMNLSLNLVRKKMTLKMVKKVYFIGVKKTYKE